MRAKLGGGGILNKSGGGRLAPSPRTPPASTSLTRTLSTGCSFSCPPPSVIPSRALHADTRITYIIRLNDGTALSHLAMTLMGHPMRASADARIEHLAWMFRASCEQGILAKAVRPVGVW